MEAMFVNHLMKAMRRTVPDADAGFARETWTALRDAELSRTVAAERGLGLQALLMRQLAPTPATSDGADAGPSNAPADAGPLEKPAEKSTDPPEFR
jgi:Rod binding domain-containing protein